MRSSFILTDLNSIVDELIANSLDANATLIKITLNIDTYCLMIEDNGDGITFENMKKIAQRHHTSKDIDNNNIFAGITSLGYKGEALASLAQISMIQIISKNKYDHKICSKLIRGGKLITIKQNINNEKRVNKKHGTTIIVKDMFFNLKIRREQIFGKLDKKNNRNKTTKSNTTWKKTAAKLQGNLVKWAVAHYHIKFVLNNTDSNKMNKTLCKSIGYSSPKYVLSNMIDPDLLKYLQEFDSNQLFEHEHDIRIWGIICDIRRLYHKKNWQLVFINKRYIQHKKIEKFIVDFLLKIHGSYKSDLTIGGDSNFGWNGGKNGDININGGNLGMGSRFSATQLPSNDNIHNRVPWYQHKQNQHHQHPIFAVFIEIDPKNVIVCFLFFFLSIDIIISEKLPLFMCICAKYEDGE